jgi:RsiW-degrading membrane proteinase PrsW (M82 family)
MQGRDMERTIKIWLSVIFPGLLGFVASCLVILPQLTLRGLGAPWDIVVGVALSGAFAVLFSRMLSRHLDEDDIVDEAPKAATARNAPFAITVR